MSKYGRKVGEEHHRCGRGGVLTLRLASRQDGVTDRGVRGLPVHVQVVGDLVCDGCGAVYACKDGGVLLTEFCRRQLKTFVSPADKPEHCPSCEVVQDELIKVYLHDPRDYFSVNMKRHGTDCLLCTRCGQVVWAFDHSATRYAAMEAEFEALVASGAIKRVRDPTA